MVKKSAKKRSPLHSSVLTPLLSTRHFQNPALLAAVTITVLVGVYVVFKIFAANQTSFEAEGSLSGTVAQINGDNTASGGSYIQFGATNGSATPPPATPPPVTPPPATPPPATPPPPSGSGAKCVINLHGAGGIGVPMDSDGPDYVVHAPNGNRDDFGLYGWRYNYSPGGNAQYDDLDGSGYVQARGIVENAMSGCGQVIIHGFSNGAGFAAAMYCKAETFSGRMIGYIVDDPEVNNMTQGCQHPAGIRLQAYLSGGPGNGWNGWFVEAMGISGVQSIKTVHEPYPNPPELSTWW